jgi:hypothetical protein
MRQTLEEQVKKMDEMEQAVDDASAAQQLVDQYGWVREELTRVRYCKVVQL